MADRVGTDETWGKVRGKLNRQLRLAMAAQGRTLEVRPWTATAPWVTGQAVKAGEVRKNSVGQLYVALNTATTGATEPTATTGTAFNDGGSSGVLWTHLGGTVGDPSDDIDPPTITNTGTISIPAGMNAVDTWGNRALFRVRGAYGEQYITNRMRLNVFDKRAGAIVRGGCSVAFWHDGSSIALEGFAGSPGIGVSVEGRPLKLGAMLPQLADNYWTTVSWSSRRPRLYEITYDKSNSVFMRVALPVTDWVGQKRRAMPSGALFSVTATLKGQPTGRSCLATPWRRISVA